MLDGKDTHQLCETVTDPLKLLAGQIPIPQNYRRKAEGSVRRQLLISFDFWRACNIRMGPNGEQVGSCLPQTIMSSGGIDEAVESVHFSQIAIPTNQAIILNSSCKTRGTLHGTQQLKEND